MEKLCPACGARISENMKICANCGKIIPKGQSTTRSNARNSTVSKPAQRKSNPDTSNRQRTRTNAAGAPRRQSASQGAQKTRQYQKPKRAAASQKPAQPQKAPVQRMAAPSKNQQAQGSQRKSSSPVQRQRNGAQQKTVNAGKTLASRFNKQAIKKYIKIAVVVLVIYAVISAVQIFRVRFSTYEFKTTQMKMSRDNYGQAIDNFFDSGHWIYNPFTFTVKYSGEAEGKDFTLKFSSFATVKLKEIEVDGEEKTDKQIEPVVMGMFI